MEDSVVAAYVALLLGCILQENEVKLTSITHVHVDRLSLTAELPEFSYSRTLFSYNCIIVWMLQVP